MGASVLPINFTLEAVWIPLDFFLCPLLVLLSLGVSVRLPYITSVDVVVVVVVVVGDGGIASASNILLL